MIKKLMTPKLVSVFFLSILFNTQAYAALNAGDIAFIGLNTDAPDGFAFVLLADVPLGEEIIFTDNGWSEFDNDWYANTEPHFVWTSPGLSAGAKVSIVETAANVVIVTGGGSIGPLLANDGITSSTFNLGGGDGVFAYQGTIGSPLTFLAGINSDDNYLHNTGCDDPTTEWLISVADMQACASIFTPTTSSTGTSSLPSSLTNGVNAVQLFPAPIAELNNNKYNGPTSGSAEFLKLEINDFTNWVNNDGTPYAINPVDFPTFNVFPNLSVTATVDSNVSVNGGSDGQVTASVSGGVAPYTYAWSNGATTTTAIGLAAGMYTVTATDDNGATATDSATVTEPTAVTVTATVDSNVSVNGGSDGQVTASVSGGVAPYTYAWSNGATTATATGLAAGIYTVTATDDNGATATDSATVTEPGALTVTTLVNDVTINGGTDGSIDATVSGGVAPYTYAWSNGATTEDITGLTAGIYNLTVTDANAASTTDSATVNEPTDFSVTTTSTDVTINGGSDGTATAIPSGGVTPYTFLWSDGQTTATATDLLAGSYTVTATDNNGATATAAATVGEPSSLVVSLGTVSNESTPGANDGSATVVVNGGVPPYTYLWSNGGTTQTITGLSAGNYSVTVTDDLGATAVLSTIVVGLGGGVVTATPVPNNSNWALLLLLLSIMMVVLRRAISQ